MNRPGGLLAKFTKEECMINIHVSILWVVTTSPFAFNNKYASTRPSSNLMQ